MRNFLTRTEIVMKKKLFVAAALLAAMGAFKFKGTRPYILILHYDESASGQIKQMVKQLPSPRLKRNRLC